MTRIITPDELRPGDVFLCRGKSEISKLISWVGDSPYSHASVFNGEKIIEAGVPGVVDTELEVAMSGASGYEFIDVYRWADSADAPHLQAVIERARYYLDKKTEYGFQGLHLVVIAVAVRRKLLSGLLDRIRMETVRWIVEQFIPDDTDRVVCSELVYRCFDEADTEPPHRMRPKIAMQGLSDRAWDIDIPALFKELKQLKAARNPDPDAGFQDLVDPGAAHSQTTEVDEAELARLEQRLDGIRQTLGRDDAVPDSDFADHVAHNPQAVIPLDFETSPSFTKIGRLAMK